MAGTRAYRRDSHGRFAGAGGGGTKVTYGKAGGFANAAHRAKVGSGNGARLAKGGSKHRIRAFVKKHPTAVGHAAGYAAILGLGAASGVVQSVQSRRTSPAARRGLSLVNKNAKLYGKNARSTSAIISRSLGRV